MSFNRNTDATNWSVRVYNEKDRVIASWIIENRTEWEAEREASADIGNQYSAEATWTMTAIRPKKPKKVKNTKLSLDVSEPL